MTLPSSQTAPFAEQVPSKETVPIWKASTASREPDENLSCQSHLTDDEPLQEGSMLDGGSVPRLVSVRSDPMFARPRFLLFVEASLDADGGEGSWSFSLEALESEFELEASDRERGSGIQRLELIGLVRGLEALEQPSRVTLVSASRYLNRGLRNGLPLWRENEWQWERFGEMTPIKDADLWKRVDHALDFHEVQSRILRIDGAHLRANRPHTAPRGETRSDSDSWSLDSEHDGRDPSHAPRYAEPIEPEPVSLRLTTSTVALADRPSRPHLRRPRPQAEAWSEDVVPPLRERDRDWEASRSSESQAVVRDSLGWWQRQADRAVRSAWLLTRRRRGR